jgi:host factor-I protein
VSEEEKQEIQDDFLGRIQDSGAEVSVFLTNGIRLIGQVEAFDRYVVQLKSKGLSQIVYKHAISTVLPQTVKEGVSARPTLTLKRSKATSTIG